MYNYTMYLILHSKKCNTFLLPEIIHKSKLQVLLIFKIAMHIFLALLFLWLSNIRCVQSISTQVLQQVSGNVTCGIIIHGSGIDTSLSCSRECVQSDGCKSIMFHGKAYSANKCKLISSGRDLT